MSAILQDVADPAVGAAIEANACEENVVFGRYLPGAEFHRDADKVWWITGAPSALFNAIWLARLEEDGIDRAIDVALAPFQERGLPVAWTTGPATQPLDLAERLLAHGATEVIEHPAMVADLRALHDNAAAPPGLVVARVTDMATLRLWREVSTRGFEATGDEARRYDEAYLAMGCGDDLPWRHYLGVLDGVPVAASSVLLHAGIAGIYGVTTVPEARRRGVGAAVTLAPLRAARDQGYRVAALFPSEMGRSMYSRLGFRDYTALYHHIFPSCHILPLV